LSDTINVPFINSTSITVSSSVTVGEILNIPVYTNAAKPPTGATGAIISISDAPSPGMVQYWNGSTWSSITGATGPAPSGVAGNLVYLQSSGVAAAATNSYWDDTSTRLGIGTLVPTANIHVVGNAYISNSLTVGAGYISARGNGGVLTNEAFGTNALAALTTGVRNTAVGTSYR
jgi:hypothetical protein